MIMLKEVEELILEKRAVISIKNHSYSYAAT